MKNYGITFGIIRGYLSLGRPDANVVGTVNNAWNGGMSYVDVYMFPCPTCGNPAGQVDSMLSNLGGTRYGMIWLDIEGSQYWYANQGSNQAFFQGLVNQLRARGVHFGIYTSASQWNPIMGSGYTGGSAYDLWYAHYDGSPNFSDFAPFGGWRKPAIKQYSGDNSLCGCGVDRNWYP